MGIKGLFALLKKKFNDGITNKKLEDLVKGLVGVDGDYFIHRIMTTAQGRDVNMIVKTLGKNMCKLKQVGLIPILVFGGINKVPEKSITNKKRKTMREDAEAKMNIVVEKQREKTRGILTMLNSAHGSGGQFKPLPRGTLADPWLTRKKINTLKNLSISLDEELMDQVRHKLEEMGILCVKSEEESDFVLAHLYRQGIVNYVFSEDSDLLTFGIKSLVRGLGDYFYSADKFLSEYNLTEILDELELTMDQFIEMCVLAKSDYTPVGVDRIGCDSAHVVIKKYGTIKTYLKKKTGLKYEPTFPEQAERAIQLFRNPRNHDWIFGLVYDHHNLFNFGISSLRPVRHVIASYMLT